MHIQATTFSLTPSAWDAYDRLTNAYGIENRA